MGGQRNPRGEYVLAAALHLEEVVCLEMMRSAPALRSQRTTCLLQLQQMFDDMHYDLTREQFFLYFYKLKVLKGVLNDII